MAKFKCKQSGLIYEFVYEHDIEALRNQYDYEEVEEEVEEVVPTKRKSKYNTYSKQAEAE